MGGSDGGAGWFGVDFQAKMNRNAVASRPAIVQRIVVLRKDGTCNARMMPVKKMRPAATARLAAKILIGGEIE